MIDGSHYTCWVFWVPESDKGGGAVAFGWEWPPDLAEQP